MEPWILLWPEKCPPDTVCTSMHIDTDLSNPDTKINPATTNVVAGFFGRSVMIGFLASYKISFSPHPYEMRFERNGFSHGLKTCHRHVFLTAFRIPSF